jgi:hypothetical protein
VSFAALGLTTNTIKEKLCCWFRRLALRYHSNKYKLDRTGRTTEEAKARLQHYIDANTQLDELWWKINMLLSDI